MTRRHRGRTPALALPRERRPVALFFAFIMAGLVALSVVVLNEKPPLCTPFSGELVGQRVFDAPPCMMIDARDTIYFARLDTSLGRILMVLDPILAPADVNNVVFLARVGYYDGLTFHRVENASDHALVQTGDPTGTGRGNAGYTYVGTEPSPIVRYMRGVVAMGNLGTPKTNGSQFFIIVRDYEALGSPNETPRYSFIGVVRDEESLATLDRMVSIPLDGTRPVEDIVIRRVTIEEQTR